LRLSATYTLIHAFLTKHSHTKAAQAVKTAAKGVVILRDDVNVDVDGPHLQEIIEQWKASQTRAKSSCVLFFISFDT